VPLHSCREECKKRAIHAVEIVLTLGPSSVRSTMFFIGSTGAVLTLASDSLG
jgi:hypothetical protein